MSGLWEETKNVIALKNSKIIAFFICQLIR